MKDLIRPVLEDLLNSLSPPKTKKITRSVGIGGLDLQEVIEIAKNGGFFENSWISSCESNAVAEIRWEESAMTTEKEKTDWKRRKFNAGSFKRIHDVLTANGYKSCLLYTSPSPRDRTRSRMPSSA